MIAMSLFMVFSHASSGLVDTPKGIQSSYAHRVRGFSKKAGGGACLQHTGHYR
jgi:hypothetical protein